jgi:hypothetical protein
MRSVNRSAAPHKGDFSTSSTAKTRNRDLGGEDSMRKSGGALERNHAEGARTPNRPLQDRGGHKGRK